MTSHRVVAHAQSAPDPTLVGTHLFAGVASALLLALGMLVLTRRASRSYALVVLALAALAARTVVSAAAMFGPLDADLHHFAEHALDAMLATFLLAAIYFARRTNSGPDPEPEADGGRGPGFDAGPDSRVDPDHDPDADLGPNHDADANLDPNRDPPVPEDPE